VGPGPRLTERMLVERFRFHIRTTINISSRNKAIKISSSIITAAAAFDLLQFDLPWGPVPVPCWWEMSVVCSNCGRAGRRMGCC